MAPGTQLVLLEQVAAVLWRNGGGKTKELLAWPSADDWKLRISVACIERDGQFSAYPGVERWFAVVAGKGVVLHFKTRSVTLMPGREVLRFEGQAPPDCHLLDGETLDLNLMTRDDAGRGELLVASTEGDWESVAPMRALFTMDEAELHIDEGERHILPAGTLAWRDGATGQRWRLAADGNPVRAWWLQFTPGAGGQATTSRHTPGRAG